ncbi:MAG: ABC transporter substrate-binding protein [Gammaproteobacteria bacterium]
MTTLKKCFSFSFIFLVLLMSISQARAKNDSILVFATEPTFPPFEFVEKGQFKGLDIDLALALCEELHKTCKFQKIPWDSLIPSLMQNKVDAIIGAIAVTEERAKNINFTQAYFNNSMIFTGVKGKHLRACPMCLADKIIGVQGGTAFDTYLKEIYGNTLKIRRYPSQQHAFLDLKAGRLDAVLSDTPIANYWLKQPGNEGYSAFGEEIRPKNTPLYYAIGVNKNNPILLDAINKALKTLENNGKLASIKKQYLDKP